MVLVDSDVLLDILTAPNPWAEWSLEQLGRAAATEGLCANAVIFAEVSISFQELAEAEETLAEAEVAILPIPHAALFRAGKVFQAYRRRGAARTGVLPDFFIGAHAEVSGLRLLTRDVARYRTYFPTLDLIAP